MQHICSKRDAVTVDAPGTEVVERASLNARGDAIDQAAVDEVLARTGRQRDIAAQYRSTRMILESPGSHAQRCTCGQRAVVAEAATGAQIEIATGNGFPALLQIGGHIDTQIPVTQQQALADQGVRCETKVAACEDASAFIVDDQPAGTGRVID